MKSILLIAALVCLLAAPSFAQVRATWFSTWKQVTSPQEAQTTFAFLGSIGMTDVYISVWNQGKVYFNSPTMTAQVGAGGFARDHLQYAIDAARPYGIRVWAWFEYGIMSTLTSDLNNPFAVYARNQGWELGQADGFMWMDVRKRPALDFLANIMIDAKTQYPDLAGLQLDDHFAFPVALVGSGQTATMNSAAQYLTSKIKAALPGIQLSISPSTISWAETKYNVRWLDWMTNDYFHEFAPQLYRQYYNDFSRELQITKRSINPINYPKLLIGIMLNGDGWTATTWGDMNNMLYDGLQGTKGVCIWYVDGMINVYPTQFRQLWKPKNPIPVPTQTPNPGVQYYCSKGSPSLNIRSTASVTATVLGAIPYGEAAASVQCCTAASGYQWRKIIYNGVTGFSVDSYLEKCNPSGQYSATNSSDQNFNGDCINPVGPEQTSEPSGASSLVAPLLALLAALLL